MQNVLVNQSVFNGFSGRIDISFFAGQRWWQKIVKAEEAKKKAEEAKSAPAKTAGPAGKSTTATPPAGRDAPAARGRGAPAARGGRFEFLLSEFYIIFTVLYN